MTLGERRVGSDEGLEEVQVPGRANGAEPVARAVCRSARDVPSRSANGSRRSCTRRLCRTAPPATGPAGRNRGPRPRPTGCRHDAASLRPPGRRRCSPPIGTKPGRPSPCPEGTTRAKWRRRAHRPSAAPDEPATGTLVRHAVGVAENHGLRRQQPSPHRIGSSPSRSNARAASATPSSHRAAQPRLYEASLRIRQARVRRPRGLTGVRRLAPGLHGIGPQPRWPVVPCRTEEQVGALCRGRCMRPFAGTFQMSQCVLEGRAVLREGAGQQQVVEGPLRVGSGPGLDEVVRDGGCVRLQRIRVELLQGLGGAGMQPTTARARHLRENGLADQLVGEHELVLARPGDAVHDAGALGVLHQVEQGVLGQLLKPPQQLERETRPRTAALASALWPAAPNRCSRAFTTSRTPSGTSSSAGLRFVLKRPSASNSRPSSRGA